MTERKLPPAINGTDMRLDALIGEIRALRDLLAPAKPTTEPGKVELREPAADTTGQKPDRSGPRADRSGPERKR